MATYRVARAALKTYSSRRVCFKARSMAYRASIGDPSEISEVAVVIWFIR